MSGQQLRLLPWFRLKAESFLAGDKPFFRGMLVLATGTVASHVLNAAAVPLLTRFYRPEIMGVFGCFASFFSLTSCAVCLRYDFAVVAAETEEKALDVLALCLFLIIPCSFVICSVLGALILMGALGDNMLPLWSVVPMFFVLLASGGQSALRTYALRASNYREMTRAGIVQAAFRGISQLLAGALKMGWSGLALGEVIGRGLSTRRLLSVVPLTQLRASVSRVNGKRLRELLYEYRGYSYYGLPANLLETLKEALPLFFIARHFSATEVGFFALAQRAWYVPLTIFGNSAADAFFSDGSRKRNDSKALKRLFWRLVVRIASVVGLIAVGAIFFGEPVADWALGHGWAKAGQYIALLAPWYCAEIISFPPSRICEMYGRQRPKLIFFALTVPLVVGVFEWGNLHHWSVEHTLLWMSLLLGIGHVGYFVSLVFLLREIESREILQAQ